MGINEEFSDQKLSRLRFLLQHYIATENELRETIKELNDTIEKTGMVRVESITEIEDQE